MSATKKIPIRRCVGCGEHFPKNTLIRVLRTPTGEITLDLVGKPHHLAFESAWVTFGLMVSDPVYDFVGKVQAFSVLLKLFNYPD